MAHSRKLVLGGSALTKVRLPAKRNGAAATRIRDELEQEMIESGYLNGAPFTWIGLIIRYGLVNEAEPHYGKIDAKDGELPLAIEIDAHRLLDATDDEMAAVYRKATLITLVHAGETYGLKADRMRELLDEA